MHAHTVDGHLGCFPCLDCCKQCCNELWHCTFILVHSPNSLSRLIFWGNQTHISTNGKTCQIRFWLKSSCQLPFQFSSVQSLSCVQLFATPWTVACRFLSPWDSSDKNTGEGFHSLLQGIFPTQGSNPRLLASPALAGESFTTEPPGKP